MASLLVVSGPPGAGKSTVAHVVADRFERSALVEGDSFFAFLRRGAIAPWIPEADEQNEVVITAAAAAAGRYVSGGVSTVYDGVVGPWFLPIFAAAAGLDRLDYVVLLPSVERCVVRVATRRGHGFTDEEATRAMHRQFADGPLDEKHLLVDPPDDVGTVADRILDALAEGTLAFSAR